MLRESTFKLDAVKEKSGWDVRSKSTGKKLRLVVGFVCSKVVGSFGSMLYFHLRRTINRRNVLVFGSYRLTLWKWNWVGAKYETS